MMTRLAAGSAPLWQLLLSIALLLVTSYLVIRSVSRFFHAQYLLSGKEFKLKFFLKAMVGKA
jgi:ABC-type Na+ efflux pump permease subunit